jgi:hypothetical protein
VYPLCKSRILARSEDGVQPDADVPELNASVGTTSDPDVEMPLPLSIEDEERGGGGGGRRKLLLGTTEKKICST